jgi:hypothetical protein
MLDLDSFKELENRYREVLEEVMTNKEELAKVATQKKKQTALDFW